MNSDEVLKKVNEIFIDVLENNKIILNFETTAEDIEEWDSLTHIQIIVAIEKYFNMRFTSTEFQSWENVGEMIDSISKKIIRR